MNPPAFPDVTAAPATTETRLELAPTMLIGLGGTGKDVMLRVRRLFYERYGHTGFPIIGYLVLDTAPKEMNALARDELPEFVRSKIQFTRGVDYLDCSLPEEAFSAYFGIGSEQTHPHIRSWLLDDMVRVRSAVDGCGQNRPLGRLTFFHHFRGDEDRPGIRDTLRERMKDIIKGERRAQTLKELAKRNISNPKVEENRLDVIVVYSIAGGTGAGMFLDVAMLIRRLVPELERPGLSVFITHIAVLPDVFLDVVPSDQKLTIQENAFAALREMEYFALRRGQDDDFTIPPPVTKEGANGPWTAPAHAMSNGAYQVRWVRPNEAQDPDSQPFIVQNADLWNTCYLLGGTNDLLSPERLKTNQLFQMIAEHVFLDFDPSEFGIWKRSWAVNNRDRVDGVVELGAFRTVSKRFSTFGLSQIYFDRPRMRRAAGYRLAQRLLDNWWLRAPGLAEATMNRYATDDLLGQTPALGYVGLRDLILREDPHSGSSRTYLDQIDDEHKKLVEQVEDGSFDKGATEPISAWLQKHEQRLTRPQQGEGNLSVGEALRTFKDSERLLEPQIKQRLHKLFQFRVISHGLPGALELFGKYVKVHQEAMQQASNMARWNPKMSSDWRARWKEAVRLPLSRRKAIRIELLRALEQARQYLRNRYHKESVPEIQKCLKLIHDRLAADSAAPSYGTVLHRFRAMLGEPNQGHTARNHLATRFAELRKASDSSHTRTVGLLRNLSEKEYDDAIHTTLYPQANAGEWEWEGPKGIEQKVFRHLRSERSGWERVNSLAELILKLVPMDGKNDTPPLLTPDQLAAEVAEACEDLLGDFVREIVALDLFFQADPKDQASYLRTLRTHSAPFLVQDTDPALASMKVNPAGLRMLGITSSARGRREDFLRALTTSGEYDAADRSYEGLRNLQMNGMQDNAIVLYQQKIGIPICYFQRVEEMGRLYDKSRRANETHFDFPGLKGQLPDIRKVKQGQLETLQKLSEMVVLGIISGILFYDPNTQVFKLDVGGRIGRRLAPVMGGDLRQIRNHCEADPEDKHNLETQFDGWYHHALSHGDGEQLAILWYALQDLREEIIERAKAIGKTLKDVPILKLLDQLVSKVDNWLKSVANSSRWRDDRLDLDRILKNSTNQRNELKKRQEVLSRCYANISEELPIPVIKQDAHLDLALLGPVPTP